MKIWTCGSSPQSGFQNAWTRIKNISGASRLSNFWNFFSVTQMISCRHWWPRMKPGYITMARRQSNNQWSGGIAAHPAPKNSECKNPLQIFRLNFLGSRQHHPHWLSSKRPNYQHGVLLLCAGAIEWLLKEKRRGKVTEGVLFLHDNSPAHRAHATQKKLAYLGFQFLDHPPYSPNLAPSDYHLFPGLKKQLKCHNFSSDAEVIAAADTWFDGQPSDFFWVACKS